jgi:hypothetical protein
LLLLSTASASPPGVLLFSFSHFRIPASSFSPILSYLYYKRCSTFCSSLLILSQAPDPCLLPSFRNRLPVLLLLSFPLIDAWEPVIALFCYSSSIYSIASVSFLLLTIEWIDDLQ